MLTATLQLKEAKRSVVRSSVLSSSNGGLNILYRAEIVINQGSAPGPWTVRLNGLQDNLGNRGPTGPAKLAGYNTAFTVVEDGPDQSID